MTVPDFFLGGLLAGLAGLGFHLLRGGRFSRLLLYLATAWISFFAGHFIGALLEIKFWPLGTLYLFPAFLATLIGLIAANILAGPEKPRKRKRSR